MIHTKSSHGNTSRGVIFLNRQECEHINYLALDILIDSKADKLPINIAQIVAHYRLDYTIDLSKSRFENAVAISSLILQKYGYDHDLFYSEYLAVKILSPLVVFKELDISIFEEFYVLSDLPPFIASLRFEHYENLRRHNDIGKYNIEKRILNRFNNWISFVRR